MIHTLKKISALLNAIHVGISIIALIREEDYENEMPTNEHFKL